jgi:hypothetical protein
LRKAELIVAALMGFLSLYLMYESQRAPLEIGWVPRKGPGSGAFPFWLSAGLLIASAAIFIRAWLGKTPQSRSAEPFMDPHTAGMISISVIAIFGLLFVTEWFGAYVAIFAFMLFYLSFLGRHRWTTTLGIATVTPVAIFLFFEGGMKILLPKGASEPLFLPLYKIFVY